MGADSEEGHPQQSRGERRKCVDEVLEQKQRHSNKRGYGEQWSTTTRRTVLLPTERENLLFPTQPNGQWDNELSPLQADDAGLCERRDTSAPPHYGEGSRSAHYDASSISATGERGTHTTNGQPQSNRNFSREVQELPLDQQPAVTVLEFRDFQRPLPPPTPGPSNQQQTLLHKPRQTILL